MQTYNLNPRDSVKHVLREHGYATLKNVDFDTQPVTFLTRTLLARAIHRMRRGASIQLEPAMLQEFGQPDRPIVNVYELDATGARIELLCHAWLNGAGPVALQVALDAEQPERLKRGQRRVRTAA